MSRRETNVELYSQVQAGDPTSINAMIENNLPYVHWRVRSFLTEWPIYANLEDELISSGYDSVVTSVHALVGKEHANPNPTGYISTAIYRSIIKVIKQLASNIASRQTKKPTKVVPLKPHRCSKPAPCDSKQRELMDEILGCCESDNERLVIQMKADGCTEREISSRVGIPQQSLNRLINDIYTRFKGRNDEYN